MTTTAKPKRSKAKAKAFDIRLISGQMEREVDAIFSKYQKQYAKQDTRGEMQFSWFTTLIWLAETMKLSGVLIGFPRSLYDNLAESTRREASKSFFEHAKTDVKGLQPEQLEVLKAIVFEQQQKPKPPGVA